MADDKDQMELPLPEVEDNTIYFENTTFTADSILASNLGKYKDVFIIGVTEKGFEYRGSSGDVPFWAYALEKARHYIMNSTD